MKLSELVRYRNNLDEITPTNAEDRLSAVFGPVIHAVTTNDLQLPHLAAQLGSDWDRARVGVRDFSETLSMIKREVDGIIESQEIGYLSNSYRLYQNMLTDPPDYILDRRLPLTPVMENYIKSRIEAHSDWKHTGAVIRPGLEPWIDYMVAFDPFYVIDTQHELLDPIKERFNESYLNRLRFYVAQESEETPMLDFLPDNQFGFILAYNFFHYKPFDVLKHYLTEIYDKLDDGGCLAFTFNDCDRWGAVALCERFFMCYTPGRLIRGLCANIGYEIVNDHVIDNATTWMEIRKPGKHRSIKGGQTLAKIIAKSK